LDKAHDELGILWTAMALPAFILGNRFGNRVTKIVFVCGLRSFSCFRETPLSAVIPKATVDSKIVLSHFSGAGQILRSYRLRHVFCACFVDLGTHTEESERRARFPASRRQRYRVPYPWNGKCHASAAQCSGLRLRHHAAARGAGGGNGTSDGWERRQRSWGCMRMVGSSKPRRKAAKGTAGARLRSATCCGTSPSVGGR